MERAHDTNRVSFRNAAVRTSTDLTRPTLPLIGLPREMDSAEPTVQALEATVPACSCCFLEVGSWQQVLWMLSSSYDVFFDISVSLSSIWTRRAGRRGVRLATIHTHTHKHTLLASLLAGFFPSFLPSFLPSFHWMDRSTAVCTCELVPGGRGFFFAGSRGEERLPAATATTGTHHQEGRLPFLWTLVVLFCSLIAVVFCVFFFRCSVLVGVRIRAQLRQFLSRARATI